MFGFGALLELMMRAFMFLYIQAWPLGAGLIAWSLVSGATRNGFLAFLVGVTVFSAAVTYRFFSRYPSAWPTWKRHFRILITRKVSE
ncbi:hypothetical protein [Desulfofundulus thermocisternus]|uniref:hypothetical protein n=1 Tax=Desulfofundulus thermocisternus TaxID=42471 RepID=UPI000480151D|nr:hypothetical protein [Desulfofundulus thermocisternus]